MRYLTTAILGLAIFLRIVSSSSAELSESIVDASMHGDIAKIRELLALGAESNTAHADGMTGLHWSAKNNHDEIIALLVTAGGSTDAVTRIGAHTPLHVASKFGSAKAIKELLLAGSNVNALTTTGATPLHFAASSGNPESIALLLEHGASLDSKEPQWGQTPLMFAAAAGRTEAVNILLERGADPRITALVIDVVKRNKIDQAERRNRNERIAAIRAKARLNEKNPSKSELDSAVTINEERERQKEREEAELRGGEPVPLNFAGLVGTHGGLTPLLLAAREGHAESSVALIRGGADINQTSAADNTSPMLIAMINGYFDLAMKLFELGADPEIASSAGATPLYAALNMHWAPKARHPQPVNYQQQKITYLEVMEKLLEAGVNPNAPLEKTLWYTTYNRDLLGVNRAGATPFWRAAHALDIKAMRLLLKYGANPHTPTTRVPERRRRRDGDDKDHSGLPPVPMGGPAVYPIHAASGVGHGQGFAGNSHRHVPEGWLPAVKFLVEELGANVNERDHNGYTPVHHAAARGDNELIHYLVAKGSNVTAVSRTGQTTVDMANGPVQRVSPFPETIALLENLGSKNNHNCVGC